MKIDNLRNKRENKLSWSGNVSKSIHKQLKKYLEANRSMVSHKFGIVQLEIIDKNNILLISSTCKTGTIEEKMYTFTLIISSGARTIKNKILSADEIITGFTHKINKTKCEVIPVIYSENSSKVEVISVILDPPSSKRKKKNNHR